MWFIGVEVEQETSATPPKKILDPPLHLLFHAIYAQNKILQISWKSASYYNLLLQDVFHIYKATIC